MFVFVNVPTSLFTVASVVAQWPATVLMSPLRAGNIAQAKRDEREAADPLVFAALFGISPETSEGNCA
jgi:hypothetical protein